MESTFARATLGFFLLTGAVTGMAWVALWALQAFAGGSWWASLLVVIVALVAEILIYTSTLHDPIYDWIKEPKRRRDEEHRHRREMELNAARESGRAGRV